MKLGECSIRVVTATLDYKKTNFIPLSKLHHRNHTDSTCGLSSS